MTEGKYHSAVVTGGSAGILGPIFVEVLRNAKFDNRWTGFSGDDIAYLGIDFGGYESHVEEKILDNILNKISTSY